MTDAVSGVTTQPIQPTAVQKPEESKETKATTTPAATTAPAAQNKPEETAGTIGAGPAQGTPTEDQAKKLYVVA